jgi:uncharacterized protein (TIGR03118 family)
MVTKRGFIAAALGVAFAGAFAAPANLAGAAGAGTFQQENLVSDQPGVAQLTDPSLVNAWGMSRSATSPIWVSDNGADVSTLYRGAVPGNPESPVSKVALTVSIPGGAPTGQVNNDTTVFLLPGTTTKAAFIFAGENGDLSAWAGGPAATLVHHTDGGVYKGLALDHSASGPMLLAADFHDNRIDVFNGQFALQPDTGLFSDPSLPAGYAPFNVAEINGQVFVTYALQDADAHDDAAGPSHGFVDVYTQEGAFVERFATHGVLNSPWGMTIAPATFGQFAGDLLIGNFGDGRIHAFDPQTGEVLGTLRGTSGLPLQIDGLWGLLVGNAGAGGPDAVWFSAGPDDEAHGLLGVLRAG